MYFRYTLFHDFVYPKYTKCAWGNSKAATDALSAAAFCTGFYEFWDYISYASYPQKYQRFPSFCR